MINRIFRDGLIILGLVGCLIGLTLIAVPMTYPGHFNFDESIELVRAYLLLHQYRFFEAVWNDHPLGLPLIFSSISRFVSLDLPLARYVILAFSSLNIAVFYALLRLECDRASALVAALVLLTCYLYVPLSGAVFNEIPALSLAMVSALCMALYARTDGKLRYGYLLLSACSLMGSLEIKLSAMTLIPTLAAMGLLSPTHRRVTKLRDGAVWLVSALVLLALLSATLLPFSYGDLISSHRQASDRFAITDPSLTLATLLKTALSYEPIYVALTIVAIAALIRSRRWQRLLPPLVWLGGNLLRFALVAPVWPNYYIHLAMPAAWLMALLWDQWLLSDRWRQLRQNPLAGLASARAGVAIAGFMLLATLLQMAFNVARIVTAPHPRRYQNAALVRYNQQYQAYRQAPENSIFRKYRDFFAPYRNSHKLLLTDNPFFIYSFQLDTPPEAAILPRKRVITEGIDGDFMLKVVRRRQPEFILLDRFAREFLASPDLGDYLRQHYVDYSIGNGPDRLFVAKEEASANPQP